MANVSWQDIQSVFWQVYELPETERESALGKLCPEEDLRAEVESLLRAHDLADELTLAGIPASVGELGPVSMSLAPNREIGPYTILQELGHGGMSTVFLAARADDEFDRLVAIKTLRSMAGPEGYQRFLAERQMHAGLEHPGIARLYGGGTTESGVPYIVMEHIEQGQPIDVYCNMHRLDVETRISMLRSVCGAVACAHQNLVIHRDLKPTNILVTPEGEPKLLDFGISKLISADGADWDPTQDGPGPLTPSYASPEQFLGEAITTASDVFSLGVVLFKTLTGQLPFARGFNERLGELEKDTTAPSLEKAALSSEHTATGWAFPILNRARRQDLEAIVAKTLRRDPAQRYGSVDQLDDDLRRWQSGLPVAARLSTVSYRLSRWLRRNGLAAGFAAAVLITLLASSLILAGQKTELAIERDRARDEAIKSERVLSLLVGLFEGSNPAKAQGSDISVRDVLLDAEPRIERELVSQPNVQAELLEAVGRVFLSLENLDEADRILNRALEIWQSTEPDTVAQAGTLDLQAQVQLHRGEFAEALQILKRSRNLRQRHLGPGSVEEASGLAYMAYAHLLLYELAEAEAAARTALEIFRIRGDGRFQEQRVQAQFHLGEALYRRGGRGPSEPIFEDVLMDAEATLGADHPLTLAILGKLSDLKSEHPAQYELAEHFARKKIAALHRIFPNQDHSDIAASLDVLAGILARKGDLEEARETLLKSIAMHRRLVGDEGPFLAITLGNLGWFHLFRLHDPETAEPILRQALDMAETFFPPEATLFTYPLIGIGRCRTLAGSPDEGEPFLRRALSIRTAAYGLESLSVARARLFLGENLTAQNRCEEANTLLQDARSPLEAAGEPDDLIRMTEPFRLYLQRCGDPETPPKP